MNKSIYKRIISTALAFLPVLAVHPAYAEENDATSPSACFQQAAERHAIPVELLIAVAQTESGLKQYAMNRAGVSIVPQSREEATAILQRIAAQRPTFDVGIMQVNRWWFEKYGEPYDKGFDLCFNVDFGARILAKAIKDHGFTWKAVGAYHSPTGWRQDAYARSIFKRLAVLLEKRRTESLKDLLDTALFRSHGHQLAAIANVE
jgi:soluble lytic murein transglycosylase-like protein